MVLREKHGPEIDTIISRYAQKRSAVLPVLYIAQDEYGHLTDAAIREVAQILDLPPTDVFEVVGFYGFLAPAGTPKDVVAKLSDAFKQVLTSPEVRDRMVSQGADPAFLGSEDFAKFLVAETPRWEKAVKASGARMD